jgi:hypothetical protein
MPFLNCLKSSIFFLSGKFTSASVHKIGFTCPSACAEFLNISLFRILKHRCCFFKGDQHIARSWQDSYASPTISNILTKPIYRQLVIFALIFIGNRLYSCKSSSLQTTDIYTRLLFSHVAEK